MYLYLVFSLGLSVGKACSSFKRSLQDSTLRHGWHLWLRLFSMCSSNDSIYRVETPLQMQLVLRPFVLTQPKDVNWNRASNRG